MKTVSILVVSAALLVAGNLASAEEGPIRVEIRGLNAAPAGGGAQAGNPGASAQLSPFGVAGKSVADWYIENMEKTVSLTPQQKEAMRKIIEARDKAAQEFQAKNGDKLRVAMKAMTDAYQSKDKEAIAKAQKEYQEISAESTKLYQQSQTDLDNVLTPEQKAKRQEAMTAQTIKSLTDPAVLTEEQVTRIKAILAKGNPGREREEHQWYQSIQDVLTPEQKAVVAKHRALANAKAGFYGANLTADQLQKVEAAYDELAKTPGQNAEAVTKQLAERVNGLLTAEQKEAMKKGAGSGWQIGAAQGQPGQPLLKPLGSPQGTKPAGSPQVIKLNEGGEGISITINGDGKVTTSQGGAVAGAGRTFVFGEGRSEKGTWLGITTEPVSETLRAQLSLAKGEGLVVGQVVPRSPAAAAGLMQNDILVRFDDQILVELSQLKTLIGMKKAGDHVKLVYLRKAARQEATATLAEHEIELSERGPVQWLQAVPGLTTRRIEEGSHEVVERLEQALKQALGNSAAVTVDKEKRFTPAPGAQPQLNPNPWKREPAAGSLDNLRQQLESSNVPAETKEKIRRNLDQAKEALEKARAALGEALKENAPKSGGGFQPGQPPNPAPKKPAE
ncbi:MAG TPA: PDZ domain-containing protein [Chthoniobacteraceae bacterium]|jgi:Spy/CpxP family protein refolding chaperone|nr:PDZ domain-containing protein [Chthoniobacteraceae bacterium]